MSRDIQLSTNSPAAADFWTQVGSSALVPVANQQAPVQIPPGPPRSPMKKVHRLLRGRYPLAIALAAAGAATGALMGYSSVPPKFESTGTVQINPLLQNGGAQPGMLPMFGSFAAIESSYLTSGPVAVKAMEDPEFVTAWRAAYGSTPLPSENDFIQAIDTPHGKGDGTIRGAFSDRNKAVAQAGTHALFRAYMTLHGTTEDFYQTKLLLDHNTQLLASLQNEIEVQNKELETLAGNGGISALAPRNDYLNGELNRLDDEIKRTTLALNDAVDARQGKQQQPVDKEFINLQIAGLPDGMMRDKLAERTRLRKNMESVSITYGARHPAYIETARLLKEAELDVDDYRTKFIAINGSRIPMINDGTEATVTLLTKHVADLKQQFNDVRTEANSLDKQREEINKVRAKIAELTGRRDGVDRVIETINTTQKLSRTVMLTDPGGEAVVDDKKRKLTAGVGLMFGGLIPVGLLMLYGLTENRFRYSDDANAADLAGVTLLGILPNLPDRLSDPQQAGIAAHCVHQIRTMLQISRSNDEPQVIAVTSAAPGDGKTSLTLALGLSYAACGARTLLVDCDLVAAGLTHRLNVSSPDGVLEAVANRALLEYVRTTDIADVAILPVGTTHAHHASTLSPVALRRLLSEAKKQFDIIIVDTGPILGSIEASLVCAAADRTILTVARNQQRPLVERSIGHLQSIGSNLAGVVFNRAQARDFEKSMNGLALRSRPPAPSGAAGKAVAGSFKRAG